MEFVVIIQLFHAKGGLSGHLLPFNLPKGGGVVQPQDLMIKTALSSLSSPPEKGNSYKMHLKGTTSLVYWLEYASFQFSVMELQKFTKDNLF